MDIEQHDYLKKFEPIEVWTVNGENNDPFLVDTIDKSFLSKIVIRPDFPEEDAEELVSLCIHVGQLMAHAEKWEAFHVAQLKRYEAHTRRAAKEENPKLTVQALDDFVVDTDKYAELTSNLAEARRVATALKQLNHTVSRVKPEMLKLRGYINKL